MEYFGTVGGGLMRSERRPRMGRVGWVGRRVRRLEEYIWSLSVRERVGAVALSWQDEERGGRGGGGAEGLADEDAGRGGLSTTSKSNPSKGGLGPSCDERRESELEVKF